MAARRMLDKFAAYFAFSEHNTVQKMEPHHHGPFYEMLYFIEGESHILINGRAYWAVAGDLAVYHPGVVHEELVQPGRYRHICLRFADRHIGSRVALPGPAELEPVFHLPWKERFRNLFEQIVLENQSPDEWSSIVTGSYLTQFSILLWRALREYRKGMNDEGGVREARVGHIIDLIHSGIDADIRLSDLAGKACMSESHFSHVFKDVTGLSPKRYLIGSKVEKAKELLQLGDDSVVDIALTLGYENTAYFSRLFKKETGLTPLEYREKSREG